jgi:hypothetical protein
MDATAPGNLLAYLVLLSYPLVAIALFAMLSPRWACAIVLIGGDMFLPSNFGVHVTALPLVDKDMVISTSALLGCVVMRSRAIFGGNRVGRRYAYLMVVLVVGIFLTCRTNPDPVRAGTKYLPGLTLHDFFSMTLRAVLIWWPAFYLGRKLFSKVDDLEILCRTLAVGGLIYSLFILIELRMSPQFNNWIYGYRQSSFDQTIRAGGYRPVVFMRHGLNLALFMVMSLLGAVGLAKARIPIFGMKARWVAVYLALVLVACHSAGALVYGIVFVPALIALPTRWRARLATILASLVLLYPLLRLYDLVPVKPVINFFESAFGAERSGSLAFRLANESDLLARAVQRPWFGWGGWGRQFIYNAWGGFASTVDGEWISVLGDLGLVGFAAIFGLMTFPILRFARKALRQIRGRRELALGSAVLFMCVVYVLDLLPNSGVAPYLLMLIGALGGIDARQPVPSVPAGLVYGQSPPQAVSTR